jgi:TPR repeat protein
MRKRLYCVSLFLLLGINACLSTPEALYRRGCEATGNERIHYLTLAAEQGHAEAQYELGLIYEFGHGVKKDIPQAVKWYRKAAEQGHAKAYETININL